MNQSIFRQTVLSALAILVGLGFASVANTQSSIFADPTDFASVANGNKIYTDLCAVCHGANLEGEPNWTQRKDNGALPAPPHDSTGHTWHHSDEVLFILTKFGPKHFVGPDYITDMPAYAEQLSDKEILDVIAFIKSTWPAEILEAQQRAQ